MNNIKTFGELFENEQGPMVRFKSYTGFIEKGEYQNGRTALELINPKNGEPIAVATVNIPEENIKDDEVIIKTYGGNEGIVEALVKAKIISEPIRIIDIGYALKGGAICKLLI